MRAVNEDANQSLVAGENSNSYGATDKGPVYKVCCDVNHQSPEQINLPNAVVITVGTNSRNLWFSVCRVALSNTWRRTQMRKRRNML